MTLRTTIADLIDPARRVEMAELRDTAVRAEVDRQRAVLAFHRQRAENAASEAIWLALLGDMQRELTGREQ